MCLTFELLINILEAFLDMQFLLRFVGWKDDNKRVKHLLICMAIYFIGITGCNYVTYISAYCTYIMTALVFVLLIIFGQGTWTKKMFIAQANQLIEITISIFLTSFFAGQIEYDAEGYMVFGIWRVILVLVAKIIYVIVTEIIVRTRIREKFGNEKRIYTILLGVTIVTFIVYSYMMEIIYSRAVVDDISNRAIIVVYAIMLLDVLIYILYVTVVRTSIEVMETRMINVAYQRSIEDMDTLIRANERVMKIRHEINNYFTNIRLMLDRNDIEETKKYIDKLVETDLKNSSGIHTGSRLVDAVIGKRIASAKENDIELRFEVTCDISSIDEMDMVVVISNLMDNALEATMSEKDYSDWIKMNIHQRKSNIIIQISNSCKKEPKIYNGRIYTDKEDTLIHGYGMKNVEEVAHKYNGLVDYKYTEGIFEAFVTLCVS